MEAAAIASGPQTSVTSGGNHSLDARDHPSQLGLSPRAAFASPIFACSLCVAQPGRLEAACWPTLSSYAARPLRSSAAPPPGASVNVHTDAWALAEPERRERGRDSRLRCSVSQQLHRAAARPKRGGSVSLRALERALVGGRAATHSLLSSSGIHQQRHADSRAHLHSRTAARSSPAHPHVCRRPTFPTNPCMDLSSLGAAPIGAPRHALTLSRCRLTSRLSLACALA